MGLARKKAWPLTLLLANTTGMPAELNTPGPLLVSFTLPLVWPLISPLTVKVSEIEPGPPRKLSTARVEPPEAMNLNSSNQNRATAPRLPPWNLKPLRRPLHFARRRAAEKAASLPPGRGAGLLPRDASVVLVGPVNRSISRLLAQLRSAPNLSLHSEKGITRGERSQPALPDFRQCEAPGGLNTDCRRRRRCARAARPLASTSRGGARAAASPEASAPCRSRKGARE